MRRGSAGVAMNLHRSLSLILLVAGLSSCTHRRTAPEIADTPAEATAEATQELNTGPKVQDFAVYGSNSIELLEQAIVSGGDVGAKNASTGPLLFAPYQAAILQQAHIGTTRNLLADTVLLSGGAIVGDVQTNHLTDTGSQHGTIPTFVTMPSLPSR